MVVLDKGKKEEGQKCIGMQELNDMITNGILS